MTEHEIPPTPPTRTVRFLLWIADSFIAKKNLLFYMVMTISLSSIVIAIFDLVGLFKADYHVTYFKPFEDNWRDSIFGIFALSLAFVALFIGFIIFHYQEKGAKSQETILKELETSALSQREILKKLSELMSDYAPFKLATVKASVQFLTWLETDPKRNTYIFYFPYTLIPGFWNDAGANFEKDILNGLEETPAHSRNKYIFIGSAMDESPFSMILDEMEACCQTADKTMLIEGLERNRTFWTKFGLEKHRGEFTSNEFGPAKNEISSQYKNKIDRLLSLARTNEDVKTVLIGKGGVVNWQDLPSCSFIVKLGESMDNEIIYIDTFGFLTENIESIFANSKMNSIVRNKNAYVLLDTPLQYHTQSRKTINLFMSNVIECCFSNNAELKSILN